MAHALPGARSILGVRATRTRHGRTTSNILWNYAHETIPRHLRDIVITEYGIADLRGRTDEEIIAALLNIADSRFQHELLAQARAAGKIGAGYRIPEAHRHNLPRRLNESLAGHRREGYFSEYPFGTDLSAEEIALVRALSYLGGSTGNVWGRLTTVLAALARGRPSGRHAPTLPRMGLGRPRAARDSWRETGRAGRLAPALWRRILAARFAGAARGASPAPSVPRNCSRIAGFSSVETS